jgi:hypothetical protein
MHLTRGSGSGRPKNIWIRRIRIRIRIRNTAAMLKKKYKITGTTKRTRYHTGHVDECLMDYNQL